MVTDSSLLNQSKLCLSIKMKAKRSCNLWDYKCSHFWMTVLMDVWTFWFVLPQEQTPNIYAQIYMTDHAYLFCEFPNFPKGSPARPPSPMKMYRYPSWPNKSCPPLWLDAGSTTSRMVLIKEDKTIHPQSACYGVYVMPDRHEMSKYSSSQNGA